MDDEGVEKAERTVEGIVNERGDGKTIKEEGEEQDDGLLLVTTSILLSVDAKDEQSNFIGDAKTFPST